MFFLSWTVRLCGSRGIIGRRRSTHEASIHQLCVAERLEDRVLLTTGYTTIVDNGNSDNRVDVLFMGDGYTASEVGPESVYETHIETMLQYLFFEGQEPYPRYANYFNVHRVDVISNESGADVPPENIFRDTALDSSYYFDGTTERLLSLSDSKARAVRDMALAGAPFTAEMQIVSVNSDRYGGGGGPFATYAGGDSSATEVALHELGHSFSDLADEYGGDTSPYMGAEPSEVNVTTDPSGAKWSHWLGYDQPGIGVIGAYEGARYFDEGLYRPSDNSKMRNLNRPFDAVSREKIILDIYDIVDPIDEARSNATTITGDDLTVWVDVIDPDVIDVEWFVDGELVAGATGESFNPVDYGFGLGTYTVTARAFDPTDWVRINLDKLEESIVWSVEVAPIDVGVPTLTAPAGTITDTTPTFAWTETSGADIYDLWVNDLTRPKSQVIRQTEISGTSYTPANNLAPGEYRAWVRAISIFGDEGEWSAMQEFTIDAGAVPAQAVLQGPIGVTNDTTPEFSWQAVAEAAHYDLWVDNRTTGTAEVIRQPMLTSTSFSPTTELADGNYRAWVRAINAGGNAGAWSSAVNFTVAAGAGIGVPSLSGPIGTLSDTTPEITWSAVSGAAQYDLWVDNRTTGQSEVIREENLTATSYTATTALAAGKYRVWVRAFDAQDNAGDWSSFIEFTIAGAASGPPTLTGPASTVLDTTPTITWTAVNGADHYDLWVNNRTTGAEEVIRETAIFSTSYEPASGLPAGNYRAWVRAIDSQGTPGAWSAARNFTISTAPSAPTMTGPTSGTTDTAPTFSWNEDIGVARYDLWVDNRSTNEEQVIREQQLTSGSFTASSPLPAGEYRAWVRAFDETGTGGDWSQPLDFTVVETQFSATYTVTFTSTWSNSTHPHSSFPGGAHFSSLIGAVHNENATFWKTGELASDGIEAMAELGATSTLTSEVNTAINAGAALRVLAGGGLGNSTGTVSINDFEVNKDFPLMTLVTMIAPSPDWFVGVAGLSLVDEQGTWIDSLTVDLYPYDAGTDSGIDYVSPNDDTNPADPISSLSGVFPFSTAVMGTFTLTRSVPTPPLPTVATDSVFLSPEELLDAITY